MGADLAATLAGVDAASLDDNDRIAYLAASERLMRWAAALQHTAVVAIAGAQPDSDDDWACEQVACALGISPVTAHGKVQVARALTGQLTDTLLALHVGAISPAHARSLVAHTAELSEEHAAEVEARVLPDAATLTPGTFETLVERTVLAVYPVGAELRRAQRVKNRRVFGYRSGDGMCVLGADLTVEDGRAAWQAINAFAHDHPHADGIDAARADAFVALLTRRDPATGPQVVLNLTMDLHTLLGENELPADLTGDGPLTPAAARGLLDKDTQVLLRRLVTDPLDGALLDYGRRGYQATGLLRRLLTTRHTTCVFPGCPRPSTQCDQDHCQPYDQGGATCPANLHPLCRRHHRLKTHTDWQLRAHDDGGLTWTGPTGARYHLPPPHMPTATLRE